MDSHDWDERYRASDLVWSATPNVFVEEIAGALAPGEALDVAAGEGRNAVWLVERGWRVTAADFSAVAVARTREIADRRLADRADRLRTVVADATAPAPPAEAAAGYDLVLFSYLQLPRESWGRALAAGVAATAPGGAVLVIAHARRNLEEGAGGPQDPAVLHDPEDVVAAAAELPVDVISAELRRREVEGAERPALDTVVLLRKRVD
ncbi:MAG TPA: methyltransferase domain-containing protein [Phycicoccus sp.]|nr:methyltransferase domain-containing protein [Phycicoccus sp.]